LNQCARVREYLDTIRSKGCSLCGYSKCYSALEFHHVTQDKEFDISRAKNSLKKVMSEVGKCICVCANCHREIHSNMIQEFPHIQTMQYHNENQPPLFLVEGGGR
jgi:hypothetical protein